MHIIENEMVDNFKDMLLSVDGGDITLALDILNNRDTTNKESEENYNEILTLIFKDNILFPNKPVYVIKIDGRILTANRKVAFNSEADAKRYLSLHLTNIIGSTPTDLKRIFADPYLNTIKRIFGTGINMRNFLVKNNLVEIVKIY
jgi:hypothetical protein